MKVSIGISPCPNDTFIFDAIYNKRIDLHGIEFEFSMMDVEQLNRAAKEGRFDVTKLSYYAFTGLSAKYQMLRSGGALGHNCGPLLVAAQPGFIPDEKSRVAIPGINTTANFLLSRAFPRIKEKTEVLFSDIEQEVLNGKYDAGLIIHESRFTYRQKGLHLIKDLGEFWEEITHTPIPLGGIVVKRDLSQDLKKQINDLVAESVMYAFDNPDESMPFIRCHAQEMEKQVIDAHIALYVNQLSVDLGEEGMRGVNLLFENLPNKGEMQKITYPLFVE